METFYLDSCAIAKRYVREIGQQYVRSLCTTSGADLYISQIARIEVVHVFCALAREGKGTVKKRNARRDALIAEFEQHCDPIGGEYDVVSVAPQVTNRAATLFKKYGIKSMDAVQLATALILREFIDETEAPRLVFVSSDLRLLKYAHREHFKVLNPEDFPDPSEMPPQISRLKKRWQIPIRWIGFTPGDQ